MTLHDSASERSRKRILLTRTDLRPVSQRFALIYYAISCFYTHNEYLRIFIALCATRLMTMGSLFDVIA